MEEKRILFICRYNRFRSVLAEAFFNKLNKNKSVKVKSAGIIKGYPLSDNVKKIARELDIKIKKSPEGLTAPVIKWQNITVIVADDIPPKLFDKNKKFGKRVIVWKIKDVNEKVDFVKIRKKALEINGKVRSLVKEFKEN